MRAIAVKGANRPHVLTLPGGQQEKEKLYTRSQIADIVGLSAKAIRYYMDKGIIEPHYTNPTNGYHYFSERQIPLLMRIRLVQDMGVPVGMLADKAAEACDTLDFEGLLDTAYAECMEDMRSVRRKMKNIVRTREIMQDIAALGSCEGWYLRYVPQRWCAVIPIGTQAAWEVGPERQARMFGELRDYIGLYGWAGTFLAGSITSAPLEGSECASYLYVELSSPALPESTRMLVIDGGCYRPAGIEELCEGCRVADCAECGRAGARVLIERGVPKRASLEKSPYVPIASDLAEPHITGDYTVYTHDLVARRNGGSFDSQAEGAREKARARELFPEAAAAYDAREHFQWPGRRPDSYRQTPARRPLFMPLASPLPDGVTAMEIPAGVYLCRQHDPAIDGAGFMEDSLAFARSLDRCELTNELERQLHLRDLLRDFHEPTKKRGPVPNPFGDSRMVADIDKIGWHRNWNDVDPGSVRLVTGTGLFEGHDMCVCDAFMAQPEQTSPTASELQFLVYADDLPEL